MLSTLVGCGDTDPPNNTSGGSTAKGGASPTSGGATGLGGTTSFGGGGSSSGGVAGSASGGKSSGGASSGGITSAGGANTGGGGSTIPATFATVAALIKDRTTPRSCFGGSCHDSENPYFHLLGADHQLRTDDDLYTFMKGYNTRECGALINVANPAQSALIKVLTSECGAMTRLMPLDKCYIDQGAPSGDCVPPEYITAIQQWIAAGAQR